jgi:hypothetical protein
VVNRFADTTSNGVPYNQFSSPMGRPLGFSSDYLPMPYFLTRTKTTLKTPSKVPVGFNIYVLNAGK